ncbi:hyaluronidase conohyal-P1-like [Babylonia areolata]|uniref:hyaluronidase conohyal-P1-like n=1 Tax=Babylonia areolata TaxID=304850 RepID=UPI003FD4B8B7
MSDCSAALCGGNGRCVHNSHDSLLNETESKRLSGQCAPRASRFRDYHCRCYSSWEGACCQDRRPTRCQPQTSRDITSSKGHSSGVANWLTFSALVCMVQP